MQDIVCTNCGNVNDYYTQPANMHVKAICNGCHRYIKMLPQGKEPEIHFGKYKGRKLASLTSREELSWLQWICRNMDSLKPAQKELYLKHLEKNQIGV